ncbi:DUF4920 domain-containing protein [Pendulispora brunnea]|uniref:DUF4920 domain-containing protein n=1 Tax=Pendulispora brunnea TaxID=2905690 RepID=A0ABZ2K920_9BACT
MRFHSWLVIFLTLATGCKMSDPAAEDPSKAAAAAPAQKAAEAKAEPIKLGEPVTAERVALADVAKNPSAFKGKTIATTGTVRAVCQERGCWMEIVDTENHANVRMHGHAFFVPKSSSGKQAKIQGTVVLVKDGKECDEMSATGAQLEFDATGVELL